ncbi:MAG TPA: dihydrolipoamide acetyltransferase family protein [Acidimicrobiales bacterium]|nr:dihydrolipoamide acetyltransferase family protein [Acidimicrobiales bacterium]
MPQLGETVTEGTVTKWLKAVGDSVERDEPLFEVSTDKVDSEVPAPAAGVLERIIVQEGETVDVGTVLAVLSGDAAASVDSPTARAAAAPPPSEPAAHGEPPAPAVEAAAAPAAPSARSQAPSAPAAAAPSTPAPASAAPASAAPSQAPGQPASAPAAPPSEGPAAAPPGVDGTGRGSKILSPVVRRLIDENGIDPAQVRGTGLGGRITRADVLAVIDTRRAGGSPAGATPARAAPAGAPAGASASGGSVPAPTTGQGWAGTDEVIPFTNIRRRTAEHMVRSKATSPHTLVVVEADYENVERVRRAQGAAFREEEGFALTYLPFVARATVEALREWPNLNASVGEDALVVHHRVNLGIAVDLDHQGLIVPVVPRAEELTLRGIARRIRELADRARQKKLSADDISGGTFSITNAGPFGTFLTSPIINQPQVAILSTDGVKRRPTVVTHPDGTEAIAIHSMGLLCLAWDHRAVDGAYAAAFVARVAELLATHDWAAEL